MSFLTKLLGKSYRTYTWGEYCSPILMVRQPPTSISLFSERLWDMSYIVVDRAFCSRAVSCPHPRLTLSRARSLALSLSLSLVMSLTSLARM